MRTLKVVFSCLMIGALTAPALSQGDAPPPARQDRPRAPGSGMRQALSPEKARAAWELEAGSVASALGVSGDKAAAMTKAYVEARTSQGAAAEKVRDEAREKARGGGQPDGSLREKMEKITSEERAKLEKALNGALTPEQTKSAMETLGGFNRGWDHMASAIAGFHLDAKKQSDALGAIYQYMSVQGKNRAAARDGDREEMRSAMQEAREKLNNSLKGILSEEQFKEFAQATGRGPRAGGPGGPGGPDGRPGRGKGGRPPADKPDDGEK